MILKNSGCDKNRVGFNKLIIMNDFYMDGFMPMFCRYQNLPNFS